MTAAIVIVILILLYFLPAIVASNRQHQSATAIFVLNLFLGWTFLGWVLALVWSFTGNTKANAVGSAAMIARLIAEEKARGPLS